MFVSVSFPLGDSVFLCITLEILPVGIQFGHFLVLPRRGGWLLTASSSFCPHQAPAACCVYCNEWHLAVETQRPGNFPNGVGAESLVQSGGSVLIPVAAPTLPCRGFWYRLQGLQTHCLCAGLEKRENNWCGANWCLQLEKTWKSSCGPWPLFAD